MNLINLNNEQKLIQGEIRKFATTELDPIADEIEKNSVFPTDIITKLSELGLLSLIIPEKYNGVDMDTTSLCITVEELSKVCASIGAILVVNNCMVAFPLIKYGQESQKDYYLNKLSNGEIGAYICDTEIDIPEKKIETKAFDKNYIVSGIRDFILNGEAANFFLMPISISEGKSFCLFEKGIAGMNLTKPEILGIRSAGIVSAEFKETELKNEYFLISEDRGEEVLKEIRDYANICFSAISLGIAQAALSASIKYSKERIQFGRRICEFPMIQEMIAEMKIKIEAARFLMYDAAFKYDNSQDYSLASKIARLHCGDMAVYSGLQAIQIHGGYGYIKDYPVERYFRDAKVIQILDITPHILKSNIAMELLK